MSEQAPLNWVEKRHHAEKNLADSKSQLWQELCAALSDASQSFNQLYGGKSEASRIHDHRFRVDLRAADQIDVDFNDQAGIINASYVSYPPRFRVRNFRMGADYESAFFTDDNNMRLTPDEVCEIILFPSFFGESAAR
jgi:hypothetical protein